MRKGAPIWAVAGYLGMTAKTLESNYAHHHIDYQKAIADL